MRYASAAAFRTGLEARLLNQSKETGVSLGRLRRGVVFERLLARLARSGEDGWVLKGGMALEIRMGGRARATKDLDLALRGVPPEGAVGEWIRSALVEALVIDPDEDWFEFRILDDRPIMPKEAGPDGWRFRIDARLAGKTFDRVRIDVAPGFEEEAGIDRLRLPAVLSGARGCLFSDPDRGADSRRSGSSDGYGRRPRTELRRAISAKPESSSSLSGRGIGKTSF